MALVSKFWSPKTSQENHRKLQFKKKIMLKADVEGGEDSAADVVVHDLGLHPFPGC